MGKIQDEKSNQCCVFLHLKSVFFLVFAPSSVCFAVFGLFWCYPGSYQFSIFTSIFSTDPANILCLFQRAHWVLCLCRTDGTTLRSALITEPMQSLCSAHSCLLSCTSASQGQGHCGHWLAVGRTRHSPDPLDPNWPVGSMDGHRHGISQLAAQGSNTNRHLPPRSSRKTDLGKALKCKGR